MFFFVGLIVATIALICIIIGFLKKSFFLVVLGCIVMILSLVMSFQFHHHYKNLNVSAEHHEKNSKNFLSYDTEQYQQKTTIVLGAVLNNPPWVYKEGNDIKGFSIDLAVKAVHLMGKDSEIKVFANDQLLHQALRDGKIDIIANLTSDLNIEREEKQSIIITNPPLGLVGVKDEQKNFKGIVDLQELRKVLRDKKIVTTKNYAYNIGLAPKFFWQKLQVTILPDSRTVLDSLQSGKYNIGLVDYYVFKQYQKEHPNSNICHLGAVPMGQLGLGFVMSCCQFELKHQFDIALQVLKRRGVIVHLSMKYFKEDITL